MDSSDHDDFDIRVKDTLTDLSAIKDVTTIVVVSNVKGITQTDDYEKYSVITDFFSESELHEIITGFRDFGFYVHVFYDESDFIRELVTNGLKTIPGLNKIVYNTSQKGIGAARHSLIPAICKLYKVPCIGSNGYVSSLCRHKYHFNKLLSQYHHNVPQAWLYEGDDKWLLNQKPPTGLKVILKPIYEAASIGISETSVVSYDADTLDLLQDQFCILRQPITVEEFVSGYEVEVPLIIDSISGTHYGLGPIGISVNGQRHLGSQILTYESVYDDGFSFYKFTEISQNVSSDVLACASQSSQVLNIEDFGRIDFRIDKHGRFFLMDITTGPHITKHSSCNFAFSQIGLSHSALLASIVGLAAKRCKLI